MIKAEQNSAFFIRNIRMNEQIYSLISMADQAINDEDFDTLMQFYSDDAVLVIKPGMNVHGKAGIRKAFKAIAAYFNHSLHVTQGNMEMLLSGDTALVLSKTVLNANNADGSSYELTRKATYVFKKVGDNWLCAIDNSYGTDILDIQ